MKRWFNTRQFASLAFVWCGWLALSQPAAAQFQNVPTSHEQVRQAVREAPLAMQFQGKTVEEFRQWQEAFSAKLKTLLGPYQPPRQWETIVEERVELDDHFRERVVLVAEGHPRLPLYRLLPKPEPLGSCPGVVAIHGHGGVNYVVGLKEVNGVLQVDDKTPNDYGRQLARRGYIVVAPVMTPFHPREQKAGEKSGTDPCAVAFVRLQLLGKVLMAENLRDCLWCVELLAQDKRVDATRLGCAGLSYGGRMTMLVMAAVEPRIKVAAISGACNVMQERIMSRYSCGAQVIPGLLQFGDVPEIGSLIAPRPCVWEIGSRDGLIDLVWADQALTRLNRAYEAAGVKDQLIVDRFEGEHNFHGAVAWPLFDKILRPESAKNSTK